MVFVGDRQPLQNENLLTDDWGEDGGWGGGVVVVSSLNVLS